MRRVLLVGLGLVFLLGILVVMLVALVTAIAEADCGNGTPTGNVTAPQQSVATMREMTKYLESQGIPAVDAAGIVGNLMQESTLNPTLASPQNGYGLASWSSAWWATTVSPWIAAHGQSPFSSGGQLMYIAANVTQGLDAGRFSDYVWLRSDLKAATTPQNAALVWMNDYEQCSGAGAPGSLSVTPNSLCEGDQREVYAQQALQAAGGSQGGGGALLTSLTPGGSCNAVFSLTGSIKGYTNPFEKATVQSWQRTDEGVDVDLTPGSPILAFAPSKYVLYVQNFYAGQPAIVFQVTAGPLAGKWWYVGEQIQPTVSPEQTVSAGQVVATYAPSGTGIEIGWWTPNGGYTLAATTTGYKEGYATPAGADFRYLLQALGANPGSGAGLSGGITMGNGYYPGP